jgi:hypothetical protein
MFKYSRAPNGGAFVKAVLGNIVLQGNPDVGEVIVRWINRRAVDARNRDGERVIDPGIDAVIVRYCIDPLFDADATCEVTNVAGVALARADGHTVAGHGVRESSDLCMKNARGGAQSGRGDWRELGVEQVVFPDRGLRLIDESVVLVDLALDDCSVGNPERFSVRRTIGS